MTGPSGNSEFCFPETLNVPRGKACTFVLTIPLVCLSTQCRFLHCIPQLNYLWKHLQHWSANFERAHETRILTSGLLFTSYFRSPQLAETCDESQSEVSSLVTLLSSVSNRLLREFASPRLLKFRFQTSHQRTTRVSKIQNGHHKTRHTRDKGKLIFYSYSNQMWGLPVDRPRFCRLKKTQNRRYPRSSGWTGTNLENRERFYFPNASQISAMVGDHSRQMKTQICTVGDVGVRRRWISLITNPLNCWAPVPAKFII